MADQGETGINWTDTTWNPIRGCSKVSPGCTLCYAEKVAARFSGPGLPYEGLIRGKKWNGQIRVVDEKLLDPIRMAKPKRIFVNSMSDLFHAGVSRQVRVRIFAVMAVARRHTFQTLTKRADEQLAFLRSDGVEADIRTTAVELARAAGIRGFAWDTNGKDALPWVWPLPNVHVGVSVESQPFANERIPLLCQTPAALRWLSVEPMLGPVRLTRVAYDNGVAVLDVLRGLHGAITPHAPFEEGVGPIGWVVLGGESGSKARPLHPDWARTVRDECESAGVPYLMKQFGEWLPASQATTEEQVRGVESRVFDLPGGDRAAFYKCGKAKSGRTLDGVVWAQFPEVSRG